MQRKQQQKELDAIQEEITQTEILIEAKKILNEKIEDLHKLAKTLLLYETLTGDEIRDLILHNKSIERNDEKDLVEEDKTSALGSMGLKPKIVH